MGGGVGEYLESGDSCVLTPALLPILLRGDSLTSLFKGKAHVFVFLSSN